MTSMNFETPHSSHNGSLNVLRESVLLLLSQVELLGDRQSSRERAKRTSLSEEVRRFEIELITNALRQTHGHQLRAARLLGVKVTTLNGKIKRYDIMRNIREDEVESPSQPEGQYCENAVSGLETS